MKAADLPDVLGDLLSRWRIARTSGEAFGDWATRAGLGQGWHANDDQKEALHKSIGAAAAKRWRHLDDGHVHPATGLIIG